jgi:tetratricopeptide (TPR) repeat protein
MTNKAPKSLSLPSIEEFSKLLRTMFINIGFFAATLLLIPSVAGQFTRSAIVIDPIAVPAAMATQGLTPEVVANRIWDGLQDFAATASDNRGAIAAIPDSQLIEFSLPDAGVSIDSIFAQIRQFFQIYETRIGGEYVCATPDCAPEGRQLRIRVVRRTSDVIDLPALGTMTEAQYFREAAAGIYAIIDPYVAIAAQAETAPLKAATLARGLIIDNTKDSKWAINLLGRIAFNDGQFRDAVAEYRSALAIDPDFHEARAGLAEALLHAFDSETASVELAELERRAPNSPLVPKLRAQIAIVAGDQPEGVRQMLLSAELDPLNPEPLTAAGSMELQAGNLEAGMTHLRAALEIDPGYSAALNVLAVTLLEQQRNDEAAAIYRQWLEFDPDHAEARVSLAMVLDAAGAYEEAAQQFQLAHDAGQVTGNFEESRGINLYHVGRYAEAINILTPFLDQSPGDWPTVTAVAGSHLQLGARQEALKVLQNFIQAAPDAPERAEAEGYVRQLSQAAP